MSGKIATRRSSRPILIGIFVIGSLFLIIGVIFWLGANQYLKEQKFYSSFFNTSVEGLEKGSAVKYQGVPVGSVKQIKVASDSVLIEVIMQIDENIAVNDELRVKAQLAGIAGGKFMQLHYPDNEKLASMHPDISNIKTDEEIIKIIHSVPTEIEEITIAAQEVMNNLKLLEIAEISAKTLKFLESSTKFLDSSAAFMRDENLKGILVNLNSSSANLDSFLIELHNSPVIDDVSQTSVNLLETSEKLEEFALNLNKQIDEMKLPHYINKTYVKYDTLMVTLNSSINRINYRTENLFILLAEVLEELKQTNTEFRTSIRKITDDPGRILSNPPEKKK